MDQNIKKREIETPILSTGQLSTLGVYRDLCKAVGFHKAQAFFEGKISVEGEDEPVLADETQMMALILEMEK